MGCGNAGNVGSAGGRARLLEAKAIGGETANDRAWPWQVLISRHNPNIFEVCIKTHKFQ